MGKLKIKQFATKEEQYAWLINNQDVLKAQRRSTPKEADSIMFVSYAINERGERLKAEDLEENPNTDNKVLKVKCVINTTNLFDSHCDVHFPGIWKKNLSESKQFFLCYEHNLSYKGIMSDVVKAYTQKIAWKELGFNYEGETEALIFECEISQESLEDIGLDFMYKRYKNGKVYNHSVRMQYVKEYWCLDSEDPSATQYKENWDKWIGQVANKEDAITRGWFYAVTEAKIIEGSAVVRGSNFVTPVYEIEEITPKQEDTQAEDTSLDDNKNNEPSPDTQKSYYTSLI